MTKATLLTLILCAFIHVDSKAQERSEDHVSPKFFVLTPSHKNTVVNGMAFGLYAEPSDDVNADTKIRGLNLELGPMGIVGAIYGMIFGLIGVEDEGGESLSFFSNEGYETPERDYPKYGTYVNGLSISVFGITETFNTGVSINGLSATCYSIKGLQLSGLINKTIGLKGMSVALLANVATKAEGIQIGLINKCQTGNVVQIGFFNRIGKRVIPLVNFRFKRDKKLTAATTGQ